MFLAQQLAKKVPELTIYFWVIKVLTTGMGEATSDFFVHLYNPYLVVVLAAAALAVSLIWQVYIRRYDAWVYWLAVSMVAVFGTMAAGILHVYLGIPYIFSATIYAVSLAVIFGLWYVSEKTLSVHSIYTRRRELFYWAAVLATFAMGTAVGDMTAVSFHLGFFASGIFFAIAIALPAVAYRLIGLNEIVAFWFAYIITRPLGASFADWLAVPPSQGGLNLGKGTISIVLWILIFVFVAYLGSKPSRCGADSISRRYRPPVVINHDPGPAPFMNWAASLGGLRQADVDALRGSLRPTAVSTALRLRVLAPTAETMAATIALVILATRPLGPSGKGRYKVAAGRI